MQIREPLSCPRCGQINSVQKVPSIVGSGTSITFYSGSGYNDSARSQTLLAQQLALPPRPVRKEGGVFAGVMILLLFIGAGAYLIWNNASDTSGTWDSRGYGGAALIGVGLLLFVGSIGVSKQNRIIAERDLPQWERGVALWMQLLYCHRRDGFYLPGQPTLRATNTLHSYLANVDAAYYDEQPAHPQLQEPKEHKTEDAQARQQTQHPVPIAATRAVHEAQIQALREEEWARQDARRNRHSALHIWTNGRFGK